MLIIQKLLFKLLSIKFNELSCSNIIDTNSGRLPAKFAFYLLAVINKIQKLQIIKIKTNRRQTRLH